MKLYYKSFTGCTASVRQTRSGTVVLTARNPYGKLFHKKEYSSLRGAMIALGRIGDDWTPTDTHR